jgi:hypothetical protein
VADPIGSGFVASLPHPGGNLTGFSIQDPTLAGKSVELLTEIAPGRTRIAALFNPDTAPFVRSYYLPSFEAAARYFKVEPIEAPVHSEAVGGWDLQPLRLHGLGRAHLGRPLRPGRPLVRAATGSGLRGGWTYRREDDAPYTLRRSYVRLFECWRLSPLARTELQHVRSCYHRRRPRHVRGTTAYRYREGFSYR